MAMAPARTNVWMWARSKDDWYAMPRSRKIPTSQVPLLETRVALNGARRLLDEYGDAVGERVTALSLLALASTLANHPSNHVANLFCHGAQSIGLSCERLLRSHHLEQKTDVNVFLLQTPTDP
jgi:hypothetical protein